jgi:hypothetical protein
MEFFGIKRVDSIYSVIIIAWHGLSRGKSRKNNEVYFSLGTIHSSLIYLIAYNIDCRKVWDEYRIISHVVNDMKNLS